MMNTLLGRKKSGKKKDANGDDATTPDVPRSAVFRVVVPENATPGTEFHVSAGHRVVRVQCPPDSQPGQSLLITIPSESSGRVGDSQGGGASCGPSALGPLHSLPQDSLTERPKYPPQIDEPTQLFSVRVPFGIQPGDPFALLAGGVRVLVTCPHNAGPGKLIRFRLPRALSEKPNVANQATQIRIKYDKDGWTRTIRAADMKFQWVHMDDRGNVDIHTKRFQVQKSAYSRKLEFLPGKDRRLRTGILHLVPANEAVTGSSIRSTDNRHDLVSHADLAQAQGKNFDDKTHWFQETCSKLGVPWSEGYVRICVRCQYVLEDSMAAVMSLTRTNLRKVWRFEFMKEAGIDAGGLAREWFQLVTSQIFDPDMGLWQSSAGNQMCMQINPASEFCCEDHLVYYRFLGRLMGKALFDRQLVAGHMVKHYYKHILGWPIQFKDLETIDEEYYRSLKQLQHMADSGEDLRSLCQDFTTTQDVLGTKEVIELVPGGADIEVTNENFPEYLEACLKYKLMDCVKPQLLELMLGLFDVIPEPLFAIFDYQELELLMCGLPDIDLDDWKKHTEYSGEYDDLGGYHPTCEWFWEVVSEFDNEMRARLLQFITGTSGVPARGFGVLQGNDGNIRKFTIHGVALGICLYPRVHTCFNRIDLPQYESKEELQEKLKLAVTYPATGFELE